MTRRKKIFALPFGYSKVSHYVNIAFNVLLSLIMIVITLPLFLVISLIIRIKYGSPVLYKGTRLGIGKEPFTMYKFRTLAVDAERIIGAEMLTGQLASRQKLVTPFGEFLRETRLDELPQLFNILKLDMDWIGPRPERPEIYEKFCKHIKGYDKRFVVKPGLIGYAQLFTPHSSPKAIRTLIDNKLLLKKQKLAWDVSVVIYSGVVIAKRLLHSMVKHGWNRLKIKAGIYQEKRNLARVKPDDARIHIMMTGRDGRQGQIEAKLRDINEEAFLIYTDDEISSDDLALRMEIDCRSAAGRRKRKRALCKGAVYKRIELNERESRLAYVIKYTPVSPLNYYLVHQYFLRESII